MAKKIGKLARRYARAFLASAEEELGTTGTPTPVQQFAGDFQRFSELWQNDAELSQFVTSPMFIAEQRLAALLEVAKRSGLSRLGEQFLRVLFERDRLMALPEIAASFLELADEAAGVVKVTIVTASAISSEERMEIEGMIRSALDGKPEFAWQVDKGLLGGILVQYGGRVIDGSVTGQLNRIEQWLNS